jgi:LysR family glycine cleavage system transcriptional activator
MTDLPPLDALRVFESAARHGHYQRAAEELFLTPSAVSHRIRSLEDLLQVKLFRRAGRGVSLTPEGRAYAEEVRGALETLRLATRKLTTGRGPLTLSLTPAIALRWLLPRLVDFQDRHPDIEVRFSSTNRIIDFERDDEDFAIRFGMGDWPVVNAERLFAVDTLPVCNPRLLDEDHPLNQPPDLRNFRLLHIRTRPDDWRMWLLIAGVADIDPAAGPVFDNMPEMLEAAVSGMGVGMADRQMIGRDIEAGQLVVPFDIHMPSRSAYHLVYPDRTKDDQRFQVFRTWLLEQAAIERDASGP